MAETEVPSGAPQAPPDDPDEEDGNGDDQMLPSQRGKAGQSGCKQLRLLKINDKGKQLEWISVD